VVIAQTGESRIGGQTEQSLVFNEKDLCAQVVANGMTWWPLVTVISAEVLLDIS
jgi:hypothetical protein